MGKGQKGKRVKGKKGKRKTGGCLFQSSCSPRTLSPIPLFFRSYGFFSAPASFSLVLTLSKFAW